MPPSRFAAQFEQRLPEALNGAAFLEQYGPHLDSVTRVDPEQVGLGGRQAETAAAAVVQHIAVHGGAHGKCGAGFRWLLRLGLHAISSAKPMARPTLPQTYAVRMPTAHPVNENHRVHAFRQVGLCLDVWLCTLVCFTRMGCSRAEAVAVCSLQSCCADKQC